MLPYFETVLDHLARGDEVVGQAFGEHVHWGYWPDPGATPASAAEFHLAAEAMLERMVAAAAIRDGAAVLDVGCGIGGTLKFLARRYPSCAPAGINIDARQLAVARPTVGAAVGLVRGDACALPFRTASLDAVLCVESIFHFPDRQRFLDECGRVLKPGGTLVLSDFVPVGRLGRYLELAERATRLIGRMYGTVHSDISVAGYRAAARAADLDCVAIDDVTANTLPTYRFLRGNLHRTERRAAYDRATFLLELFSKLRLVRYLILTFRKPASR